MKVSPLAGAASTNRTAMLQMLNQAAAGPTARVAPMPRPASLTPPPPRASSFGGADPRAMFEALVQKLDGDGDGKLSLDEVNALNQGGLLARNFGRIDNDLDGRLTRDEVASHAPWGGATLPSGDQRGADVGPLFDKLTDHLNTNSDTATAAESLATARRAEFAAGLDRDADAQPGQTLTRTSPPVAVTRAAADPATLMESMVLALSTRASPDTDADRAEGVRPAASLR